MPREVLVPFEDVSGWGTPYPADAPAIALSASLSHTGMAAAEIAYHFDGPSNDYVAYPRIAATTFPVGTTRIGLWVYGDGSGNLV
jgi:hypothetical protein